MEYTKGHHLNKLFEDATLVKGQNSEWYSNEYTVHDKDNRIIYEINYQTDSENQGYGKNNKLDIWEGNARLALHAAEMYEALKGIYRLRNIILPPPEEVKAEHQDEVMAVFEAIKKIKSILSEL